MNIQTSAPDNSEIVHHQGGGFTLTGKDAMSVFRALTLSASLKLYAKTKMIPTRGVTITVMLRMASEITGKKYKRTEVEKAAEDVHVWAIEMRDAIPHVDKSNV